MAKKPDRQQKRPNERVEGGFAALGAAVAARQAQPDEDPSAAPVESKRDRDNRQRRERRARQAEEKAAAEAAAQATGGDPQPTGLDAKTAPETLDYSIPENNLGRVFSVAEFMDDDGLLIASTALEDGVDPIDVTIVYPPFAKGDGLPDPSEKIRIVRYENPSFAAGAVRYFAVLEAFKENYLTIEARKEDAADFLLPGDRIADIQLVQNNSKKARSPFLFEQSRFGKNERFYIEGGLSNIPNADDAAALTDQFTIEVVRCLGPREQRDGQWVVEYQAVIVERAATSFDPIALRNELNTKEDRLRAERIGQLPERGLLPEAEVDFIPADRNLPLERYNNDKDKKHPLNGSFIYNGKRNGKASLLAVRPLIRLFKTNSTEPLQQIAGQDIAVVGQLRRSMDHKTVYDGLFRHDIEFVQLASQYEQLLRQHEAVLRAVSGDDTSPAAVEIQGVRAAVVDSVSVMSFGFDDPEMMWQALQEFKKQITRLQTVLQKNEKKVLKTVSADASTEHHEQDIFLFELGEFEKRFPLSNADLHTQRVELYKRSIEAQIDPTRADQLNAIYSDIANVNHRNDLDRHARIRGLLAWAKAYSDRYPEILAADFGPKAASALEATGSLPAAVPPTPDAQTGLATPPVSAEPVSTPVLEAKKTTGPFVFNENAQSDTATAPQPPLDDLQDTTAWDAQPESKPKAPEQPVARSADKPAVETVKKSEEPPKASPLERLLKKMGVAADFPVDQALAAGKMTLALVGGLVSYSGGPDKPDIYPVAFDIHGLQWDDEKPDGEAKVHMTERYASPKGGLAPGGKPVIRPISLFKQFGPFRLLYSTPIPAEKPAVQDKAKSGPAPIPEELRVNGSPDDLKRWTTDMAAVPPAFFVAQEPAPEKAPVVDDPEIELYNPSLFSDERQKFIDRALTPPVPPLDTTSFVKEPRRPARTTERPTADAEAVPAAEEETPTAAPVSAGVWSPNARRPFSVLKSPPADPLAVPAVPLTPLREKQYNDLLHTDPSTLTAGRTPQPSSPVLPATRREPSTGVPQPSVPATGKVAPPSVSRPQLGAVPRPPLPADIDFAKEPRRQPGAVPTSTAEPLPRTVAASTPVLSSDPRAPKMQPEDMATTFEGAIQDILSQMSDDKRPDIQTAIRRIEKNDASREIYYSRIIRMLGLNADGSFVRYRMDNRSPWQQAVLQRRGSGDYRLLNALDRTEVQLGDVVSNIPNGASIQKIG